MKYLKIVSLLFITSLTYSMTVSENLLDEDLDTFERMPTRDYEIDLAYLGSKSPLRFSRLNGFQLQYTFISEPFSWLLHFSSQSIIISEATALTGSFDADDEFLSVTEVGVGLRKTSFLINDFISSKNITDELSAIGVYGLASTDVLEDTLAGFGLVASYGLKWQFSTNWSLKAKLSYHVHSLEYATDTTDVEATASWINTNLGIALSF